MSASVKAGLVGAGVAVVLALLGLVPCLACLTSVLVVVLYAGTGVLAAVWMETPRDVGRAAGGGAVASLIAALVSGITNVIITAIRFTLGAGQSAVMRQFRQLPPELREPWQDLGIDPSVLASPAWAIGSSALCCGVGLVLAAALGAAAGAITASLQGSPEASV